MNIFFRSVKFIFGPEWGRGFYTKRYRAKRTTDSAEASVRFRFGFLPNHRTFWPNHLIFTRNPMPNLQNEKLILILHLPIYRQKWQKIVLRLLKRSLKVWLFLPKLFLFRPNLSTRGSAEPLIARLGRTLAYGDRVCKTYYFSHFYSFQGFSFLAKKLEKFLFASGDKVLKCVFGLRGYEERIPLSRTLKKKMAEQNCAMSVTYFSDYSVFDIDYN